MNTSGQSCLEIKEQCGKNHSNIEREIGSDGEGFQSIGNPRKLRRRSFMKGLALGGVSLLPVRAVLADKGDKKGGIGSITDSDAAILRFLAAAEILETDLWVQYTEFADLSGPYSDALKVIDDNMPPYIEQNTADE